MRHRDVVVGKSYLFTDLHGHGLGRCMNHYEGGVVIVPPLPKLENGAFCARTSEGSIIEVYADELSCPERKPGSIVSFGDTIEEGTKLRAVKTVCPWLIAGEVYTFQRWNNGFTLSVCEVPPDVLSGGFKPERFVYV